MTVRSDRLDKTTSRPMVAMSIFASLVGGSDANVFDEER